ncbi:hypothetical protein DICVIV_08981 [Dictyocaulus viviparus]|uniref:Uncharacterized protein n=1 Tax=Dictyocaulus viviparus TaxID=29172 RepID=A0A0D8XMJ5_DICVI|nr:hypothetical protein DICVIV_08981 [Dictyocaulus viviparus]
MCFSTTVFDDDREFVGDEARDAASGNLTLWCQTSPFVATDSVHPKKKLVSLIRSHYKVYIAICYQLVQVTAMLLNIKQIDVEEVIPKSFVQSSHPRA